MQANQLLYHTIQVISQVGNVSYKNFSFVFNSFAMNSLTIDKGKYIESRI